MTSPTLVHLLTPLGKKHFYFKTAQGATEPEENWTRYSKMGRLREKRGKTSFVSYYNAFRFCNVA